MERLFNSIQANAQIQPHIPGRYSIAHADNHNVYGESQEPDFIRGVMDGKSYELSINETSPLNVPVKIHIPETNLGKRQLNNVGQVNGLRVSDEGVAIVSVSDGESKANYLSHPGAAGGRMNFFFQDVNTGKTVFFNPEEDGTIQDFINKHGGNRENASYHMIMTRPTAISPIYLSTESREIPQVQTEKLDIGYHSFNRGFKRTLQAIIVRSRFLVTGGTSLREGRKGRNEETKRQLASAENGVLDPFSA